jgi:hypothetical protein
MMEARREDPKSVLLMLVLLAVLAGVALVPAHWVENVALIEQHWLEAIQGRDASARLRDQAARWRRELFADSGTGAASPDVTLGPWMQERIAVGNRMGALIIERCALLYAWWPYLLSTWLLAASEGMFRRKIRAAAYSYDNPRAHHRARYALMGMVVMSVILLLAPLPFPAIVVPIVGLLLARLFSTAITRRQLHS